MGALIVYLINYGTQKWQLHDNYYVSVYDVLYHFLRNGEWENGSCLIIIVYVSVYDVLHHSL